MRDWCVTTARTVIAIVASNVRMIKAVARAAPRSPRDPTLFTISEFLRMMLPSLNLKSDFSLTAFVDVTHHGLSAFLNCRLRRVVAVVEQTTCFPLGFIPQTVLLLP